MWFRLVFNHGSVTDGVTNGRESAAEVCAAHRH